MHRFWLSWYAFVLHTLMFLMVCGGHVFAPELASSELSSPGALQPVVEATCVSGDSAPEEHDGGLLFDESETSEEIEEVEISHNAEAFSMPPSELFWLSDFDASYEIANQRGRAPPQVRHTYNLPQAHHLSTTYPSRGPPTFILAKMRA